MESCSKPLKGPKTKEIPKVFIRNLIFLNSCYTCWEFNELVAQAMRVGVATIAGILKIVARSEKKKTFLKGFDKVC